MLDKSKPFGTIYPKHNGAKYEQGGVYFDVNGRPIGRAEKVKPVPAKMPSQVAAQLGEDADDVA